MVEFVASLILLEQARGRVMRLATFPAAIRAEVARLNAGRFLEAQRAD